MDYALSVGDRILLALKRANMTQYELAQQLEKNPSTVSRWISGQTSPKVDHLRSIAQVTRQRDLVLDLSDLPDQDLSPLGWMGVLADEAARELVDA